MFAPVYFISDTHLCDGTGADRFHQTEALLALLGRITDDADAHLVLLGDIAELWACSLEAALIRHAAIFHAIARVAAKHPVTYVVGNHDCLPWYYYLGESIGSIQVVERWEDPARVAVAIHGHQFDPFNQVQVEGGTVKAPFTRKLTQLTGILARAGGPAVNQATAEVGDRLVRAAEQIAAVAERVAGIAQRQSPGERGYPPGERIYLEAARGLMCQGARFVVMGHTHHPLTYRVGANTYINTGSWVEERYPPTYGRLVGTRLELLNGLTHELYRGAVATDSV